MRAHQGVEYSHLAAHADANTIAMKTAAITPGKNVIRSSITLRDGCIIAPGNRT